ncbi:YhdP family protein [Teredinibacter haidensis]|uniref:YhdP family phospholipid transporter n=1 Tax=Teredinibacter haidensis TaxID=2731755 RepID=UPI000948D308|nr:DUF3971 domain-containing protein [Teredinibacter haidensis]
MVILSQRTLRRLARRFWGALFTLVIALAVFVQLGREAFPLLDDYRDDISQLLGKRLGVNLTVGGLSADWSGLRPQIELRDVVVTSKEQQKIFKIDLAVAELGLVDSLLSFSFQWRHLSFHQLETTLIQAESGTWLVKHLPITNRGNASFTIDDPLDIFLFGRRIELENANFNLEFRTGHTSVLSIPTITLENDKNFHRATASAGVLDTEGQGRQHFQLTMEGTGDPRDAENFNSVGYLALRQFPMERVVAAFADRHWQNMDQQQWGEGHRLDLELWFNGTTRKGMSLSGRVRSDGLPLEVPESVILPKGLASDISGRWHPKDGWRLMLQQLAVDWPEFQSPPLNVQLSGGLDRPVTIGVDHLDLQLWHDLAKKVGYIQGQADEILNTLSPTGLLNNIEVTLAPAEEGYFRLKADLGEVGVQSFRGSPIIEKLNGFVSASAFDGYVDIDSQDGFSIAFPNVYEQPMLFDTAVGRVGWLVDNQEKLAYVNSNRLQLVEGEETANAYLHLMLPTVRDGREPTMTLAVGLEKGPLSLQQKFVPKVVRKSLKEWLDRSIGRGTVSDLAFLFHGSISKKPLVRPSILLSGDVHNADLDFDPQWPPLKNIEGDLSLGNDTLDIYIQQASLLGNRINQADVTLISNPEDDGHALAIDGQLQSDAGAAMALLQQSPVRELLGSAFDSWDFSGAVSAAIQLQLPLKDKAKGAHQNINVDFSGARVDMRDIDLSVNKVKGKLSYQSDKGLSAAHLEGELWGKPIAARVESPLLGPGDSRRNTVIHFKGPVDIQDVRRWTKRPELGFTHGSSEVTGKVTIPAKGSANHVLEVGLSSQLKGVDFQLPKPLLKDAEQEKPFEVNLKLFDGFRRYQFDYDNMIGLRMQTGDAIENSGQIYINESPMPLQPGFFDVIGHVEAADLQVWDGVREQYFSYVDALKKSQNEAESEADLPIRLNLDIGKASIGDTAIDNVHVNGLGTEARWDLRVASETASGNVIVSGSEDALNLILDLDHLRLGSDDGSELGEEDKAWSMAEMELSKLTFPVDFSVKELIVSGKPFGRWAFDMNPLVDGVHLTNIRANVRGIGIGETVAEPVKTTGNKSRRRTRKTEQSTRAVKPKLTDREEFIHIAKQEPAAEFIWRQTDEGQSSFFKGTLMGRNIGELLEAWGSEKLLDSKMTIVRAEVSWPGAPDEIHMEEVSGQVIFDLRDGSFIRGAAEADNGLLRLIALFNFDTIVRRLKLDFSDLAKEGFAFDSVHGGFDFENGWVYINQPLVVQSTSSKMQVAGTLDLMEEKIDAQLVATLPVAGDITVAAALIAGLPAAVGVYLISKMFEKQVDKVSSINYAIRGSWSDPKIKFRKIFDDTAASEKGREVESISRDTVREGISAPPKDNNFDPPEPTPLPE